MPMLHEAGAAILSKPGVGGYGSLRSQGRQKKSVVLDPPPARGMTAIARKSAMRELDHGLAGGDLLAALVAHHDVDQNPARVSRGLLRFHDAARLDGVAGPDRLDPAGFEPPVNGAGWIGPVGDHARDQPEIVHAVHDDAAEIGLAEIALHVVVVQMQRVVVERGVAKQTDGFAADREFRPLDGVAGAKAFKRRGHGFIPSSFTAAGWSSRGRSKSPRRAG